MKKILNEIGHSQTEVISEDKYSVVEKSLLLFCKEEVRICRFGRVTPA
jgi:hypothetical protein